LKIKYISLTNLNAKEEVFSELLQEDFTVARLLSECKKMEENKEMPPFDVVIGGISHSVTGQRGAITATTAARKVPSRYKTMIGFMLVLVPIFLLAIAAITKTKISNGATARSERTKICPNTPTFSAKLKPNAGCSMELICATIIPNSKPIAMRLTKLPWKNKEIKREIFIMSFNDFVQINFMLIFESELIHLRGNKDSLKLR